MKFTQLKSTTFQELVMNAGILVSSFTPATGTIGDIIGATSGGMSFSATQSTTDMGEDIDNCPKNTKELLRGQEWTANVSGTFLTVTSSVIKSLLSSADISSTDSTKVVPRTDIASTDFSDIWLIGDYSDKNTGDNAGYLAIHLKNARSMDGFNIKTANKAKGTFSFNYQAYYSIEDIDDVPFEIYVKAGT